MRHSDKTKKFIQFIIFLQDKGTCVLKILMTRKLKRTKPLWVLPLVANGQRALNSSENNKKAQGGLKCESEGKSKGMILREN